MQKSFPIDQESEPESFERSQKSLSITRLKLNTVLSKGWTYRTQGFHLVTIEAGDVEGVLVLSVVINTLDF